MKRLLLIPLLMSLVSPVNAENVEVASKDIGGVWDLKAYVDDTTKEFSHCLISTNYLINKRNLKAAKTDQVNLTIKMYKDGGIGVGLIGNTWNLVTGRTYNIAFKFPKNPNMFSLDGTAHTPYVVAFDAGTGDQTGEWIVEMARNSEVEFYIEHQSIGWYRLNKSKIALETLMECYAHYANDHPEPGNTFGEGRDGSSTFGDGR